MACSGRQLSAFGERWNLHSRGECASDGARPFPHQGSALIWLRSFKADRTAMHNLRVLAAQRASPHAWRYDDESVLQLIAPLLTNGSLQAHRILRSQSHGRNPQDVAAPAQQSSTPARPSRSVESVQPVTPKPESAEPTTFSAATDAQATATVLQQAAQSGAPFCEECAKAAA